MSLRFWTICLLLALLPLRGWAAASMAVPAARDGIGASAVQTASVHADDGHADTSPCHEEAVDTDTASSCHDCSLCDICHAAVADVAAYLAPRLPLPGVAPRTAVSRDTGRNAVDGLERPPRHDFA